MEIKFLVHSPLYFDKFVAETKASLYKLMWEIHIILFKSSQHRCVLLTRTLQSCHMILQGVNVL